MIKEIALRKLASDDEGINPYGVGALATAGGLAIAPNIIRDAVNKKTQNISKQLNNLNDKLSTKYNTADRLDLLKKLKIFENSKDIIDEAFLDYLDKPIGLRSNLRFEDVPVIDTNGKILNALIRANSHRVPEGPDHILDTYKYVSKKYTPKDRSLLAALNTLSQAGKDISSDIASSTKELSRLRNRNREYRRFYKKIKQAGKNLHYMKTLTNRAAKIATPIGLAATAGLGGKYLYDKLTD